MVTRVITALIIVLISLVTAGGQSAATADATATIITPLELQISRHTDTTFTNLAINSTNRGEEVVVTEKSETVNNGTPSARIAVAKFSINSNAPFVYAISLPSIVSLTHVCRKQKLIASTVIASKQRQRITTGTQHFQLYADLSLADLKHAGLYTSELFAVTVNHN